MCVLVNRVLLYDTAFDEELSFDEPEEDYVASRRIVPAYSFVATEGTDDRDSCAAGAIEEGAGPAGAVVAVLALPGSGESRTPPDSPWLSMPPINRTEKNPLSNKTLAKYWRQRRRLFSKYDAGIRLDEQGWYSVTPEQIADHVASRLQELLASSTRGRPGEKTTAVVLDAFCGCGGNAIAFAKLPNVIVLAVDLDRDKLRMAAHNASIYEIPANKIVFVECNVLFLLEHCYRNGDFVLDQPLTTPDAALQLMDAMPPPVASEVVAGFQVGGIDLLPRRIDAVFMDPPWGGVNYELIGKNGYDLAKHMKIQKPASVKKACEKNGLDGFFDTFQAEPRSKLERVAQFNAELDDASCLNGEELLALAAAATQTRWVIYDMPRNVNREQFGHAALRAGYRGNCKLEEHYLNGRLKTVTAYLGTDWNSLLGEEHGGDVDSGI
jgi:trimethylguanosine synthase